MFGVVGPVPSSAQKYPRERSHLLIKFSRIRTYFIFIFVILLRSLLEDLVKYFSTSR